MEPEHVAIIMDGNGRWAKKRGLPRAEGHRAGAQAARRATEAAGKAGLRYLTLYALSTENLYRPQAELDALMGLMRHYLDNEVPRLVENRVRLRVIGDRTCLPGDMRQKILWAERETSLEFELTLVLAVCYGGRDEIVRAVRSLSKRGSTERLSEKRLSRALDTGGIPDPDLLIRTGGDQRISNFLLWQCAYTELYFTKTLWPDFRARHLRAAVESYKKRERRFGKTGENLELGPAPSKKKRGKLR